MLSRGDTARRSAEPTDRGFTLIEVIVALALLSIVATAVLAFYVRGMQATSHIQRSQSADTVAMEAMEAVRSVAAQATNAGGTSALIIGRSQSAVTAAWTAASPSDTADTDPLWDPAPGANPQNVPISQVVNRDGIPYTVTTLIGRCYRLASGTGAAADCTRTNPGGAVPVMRVTVVVTWDATAQNACAAGACSYRLTALIDPSDDASWNLSARPVAYDDTISTVAGTAQQWYEIVATNDVIGSVITNPVIVVNPPTMGSYAIGTASPRMGMLSYTPPTNASGPVTMTYKLRDSAGRTSNTATVSISVAPKAVADSFQTYRSVATPINLGANDLGTFGAGAKITITTPLPNGSGTLSVPASGTTVTYTAPASGGTSTSFAYSVTDASGLTSAPVTVSLAYLTYTPPTAPNLPITIPAQASPVAAALGLLAASGNDAADTLTVLSGPTPVAPWTSPGSLSGSGTSALAYTPVASTVGVYTFTYKVTHPSGTTSPTGTITVTVAPAAVADPLTLNAGQGGSVVVWNNDVAPTTGRTVTFGAPTGTCTGVTAASGTGTVTVAKSAPKETCTVPYTLTVANGSSSLSAASSVTVTVK